MEEQLEPYRNHKLSPDEIQMKVFSHQEYLESAMDFATYKSWAEGKIEKYDGFVQSLRSLMQTMSEVLEKVQMENQNLKDDNDRLRNELAKFMN